MTVDDFIRLVRRPEAVQAENEAKLKEIADYYPYFSHAKLLYLKALQKSDSLLFDSRIAPTALYASHRDSLYYYLYPDKKLGKTPEEHQREERFSGSYFDLLDMAEGESGERPISLKKIAEQLKASRRMMVAEQSDAIAETAAHTTNSAVAPKATEPEKDASKDALEPLDEEHSSPTVSTKKRKKDNSKKVESLKDEGLELESLKDEGLKEGEKEVSAKLEKPYIPVPDYFKEEDPTANMSLEEKSKWYIKEKNYEEAIKILRQLYLINPKKSVYFADQIRFLEKIMSKTI